MAEELMRPERLQIMLSPEELKAVDDFRFQTRMPSRAAAVRELLKRGLAAEGFEIAVTGMKSQSFGVLGRSPRTEQRQWPATEPAASQTKISGDT